MSKIYFSKISRMLYLLVDAYFKLVFLLSKKDKLFIFTLVFGLFLAASVGYYIYPLRYIFVLIALVFIFMVYPFKYKDVFYLFLFFFFLIVLNIYASYFLQDNFDFTYFHLYLIMLIGYILSKENLLIKLKPYIKFILLINLYFLINEKFTGIPFVPWGEGRELSLVFYGQGIFGYTKNAADAIGLVILMFRKDLFWKFIILISVILIGIRSSIVFVGLIIIIDIIMSVNFNIKLNIKKIFLGVVFLFIGVLSIYFLQDLFYLNRLESLFRVESTTYTSRFYYAEAHLNCFAGVDIFQLLFGSGTYCPSIVRNGSENVHIMFFTHFGLVHYGVWLSFFLFIIFSNIKKHFFIVYPLGLYLLIGLGVRWGLGWMGGVVLYTYLFNIYFKRKVII